MIPTLDFREKLDKMLAWQIRGQMLILMATVQNLTPYQFGELVKMYLNTLNDSGL